jgi:hypothetical protein
MRPEAVILYCTLADCGAGYGSVGEIPPVCPSCRRATRWTTTPPNPDRPTVPYSITHNDELLMKARGILND